MLTLSVVVRVFGGPAFLGRCLERLTAQAADRVAEIIVPYDFRMEGIDGVCLAFPAVRFVACMGDRSAHWSSHRLLDARTSQGLKLARGRIVAILEDTVIPAPDWCDQVLEAHSLPHGVIGGAVEHEGRGALNWAVYWLDFGRYQPPLAEGPARDLTDINVSYKRDVLESVRDRWERMYNEATVHWALARNGATLWLRPQIVVHQDRGKLALSKALVERVRWGRVFGAARAREDSLPKTISRIVISPFVPFVLVGRVAQRGRLRFVKALIYTFLLAACWTLGEVTGYVRAAPRD